MVCILYHCGTLFVCAMWCGGGGGVEKLCLYNEDILVTAFVRCSEWRAAMLLSKFFGGCVIVVETEQ